MKKLSIIMLSMITAFSLYGCSTALVEREPVAIQETTIPSENDLTSENTNNIDTANQSTQNAVTEQNVAIITPTAAPSIKADKSSSTADIVAGVSSDTFPLIIGLEGMEETINAKTYTSLLGYQMAFDSDRFTVTSENDTDSYMAENPDPELYPYVYLNISKVTDAKEGTFVNLFHTDGVDTITRITDTKIGEYVAQHYKAISGSDWNSIIRNFYVIPSGSDVYIIETQYFLEAEEGFGARMAAMLNTFHLVP